MGRNWVPEIPGWKDIFPYGIKRNQNYILCFAKDNEKPTQFCNRFIYEIYLQVYDDVLLDCF